MVNGRSTVHHDYEGPFTAEEIDEELEKGVDGKRLQMRQQRLLGFDAPARE